MSCHRSPLLTCLYLCTLSLLFVVVSVECVGAAPPPVPIPEPTVYWYEQLIDHYSSFSSFPVFGQQVLVCTEWFDASAPLILFYTGNEGPIRGFYDNTGQMFEWAQSLSAAMIFVEHRYYGDSIPSNDRRYLSIPQALADYAAIIENIQVFFQSTTFVSPPPVIAVGGSYGGVLSAWIRLRYPHLIAGAIAASAPIAVIGDKVDYQYFQWVTHDFNAVSSECSASISSAYAAINQMFLDNQFNQLQSALQLCSPPSAASQQLLYSFMRNALLSLAQYDYPYPTNFESPLPANPVVSACSLMFEYSSNAVQGLEKLMELFYGAPTPCFTPSQLFTPCADPTGCGGGNDGQSWDWQVCSEFTYYTSSNNVTDFFPAQAWNIDLARTYCSATYGLAPRPTFLASEFGSSGILQAATNIVFSSGALDPYSRLSFLPSNQHFDVHHQAAPGVSSHRGSVNPSLILLLIDGAAHHLDLRASNPLDPSSVVAARQIELENIKTWVQQWNQQHTSKQQAHENIVLH